METLDLGSNPGAEECVQVGRYEYTKAMRLEVQAYRRGLIKLYGKPPEGCRLKICSNPHDFGSYLSLEAQFDGRNQEHIDWALRCEHGFDYWADAGLRVELKRAPDGSYLDCLVHELEEPPLAELDGAD